MNTILIIDDDTMILSMLKDFFEGQGFQVETATRAQEGWDKFIKSSPFLVISDQMLPDAKGIEILQKIKKYDPQTKILVITGYGEIKDAVKAMELGAMNYLTKPVDLQELKILVNQARELSAVTKERDLHRKKLAGQVKTRWEPLLFNSACMKEIFNRCQEVAKTNTTILLQGETGVGKGLFAHYIHQLSNRAQAPFIDIDCGAIPETLIESELFGYEAGAFTDAKRRKDGLIELANAGTLFLDEISNLPMTLQGKLIKVIEEKSFHKLGGTKAIGVDVRVIAATNTDLKEASEKGQFRKDLYFRLNTFPITLPPLRQRPEDIIPLAKHFLVEISQELHKDIGGIDADALDAMVKYDWPGNIRELRNTIEKALIIAQGKNITINDISLNIPAQEAQKQVVPLTYVEAMDWTEKEAIQRALSLAAGNQSKAAEILQISRKTVYRLIKKYGLQAK